MITMSTCSDRIACTATGPTSPSDGVRSPPVSTTVRSGRGRAFSTSATLSELVTTVRFAMSPRCRASVQVVLPAVIAIAMPGRISVAARAAIASFSGDLAAAGDLESGLDRAGRVHGRGAAVHLREQPLAVEHLEVAAHRHVRDAQQRGQVGDLGAAGPADLLEDLGLAHRGEHARSLRRSRAWTSRPPRTVPNGTTGCLEMFERLSPAGSGARPARLDHALRHPSRPGRVPESMIN